MGQLSSRTFAKLLAIVFAFSQLALRGPTTASAQLAPDPNDLLRACVRASDLPPKIACHQEVADQYTRRFDASGITASIMARDLARDGDRLDISYSDSAAIKGVAQPMRKPSRDIWTDHQDLHRQPSVRLNSGPVMVFLFHPPRQNPQNLPTYGLFIDGVIRFDDRPLAAILLDSGNAKLQGQEIVNGNPCWIVQGITASGNYKLWLDPSAGNRIRQAEVIKKPGDLVGADGPLPLKLMNLTITDVQISIHDITFQKFGNTLIPVSGQLDESETSDIGDIDNTHEIATRTNIQINPDFTAIHAFTMDGIPDETPVQVNRGHAAWVWRNGKVVNKLDSSQTPFDDEPATDESSPSTRP